MFADFADQWTPVLPSSDVRAKPRRVVVAGEALVVWRDNAGRAAVLLDRCPHRSVSLALGSRTREGGLACKFHGWEFGTDGACAYVPFNPQAPRERLGATAVPHRELGGMLWVYTGFDPQTEPYLPEHLRDDEGAEQLTRFYYHEEWDAHWTRAMENMLDYPHLPFVHRNTIGRFVRAKATRSSRLIFDLTDTAQGFRFGAQLDDHEPSAWLRWLRPNSMILDVAPEPRMMRIQIYCIPAEPGRVRMLLVTARNFSRNPLASPALDRLNVFILHQDRAVVESSDPVEVPPGKHEKSVRTDRPTLEFRSWYLRELKGSSAAPPAPGAPPASAARAGSGEAGGR